MTEICGNLWHHHVKMPVFKDVLLFKNVLLTWLLIDSPSQWEVSFDIKDHKLRSCVFIPTFFIMAIPLPGKTVFILIRGPDLRRSQQPFLMALWVIKMLLRKLSRHFHFQMSSLWGWIWQLEIVITEIMNGFTSSCDMWWFKCERDLTHWILVMLYGIVNLGQNWIWQWLGDCMVSSHYQNCWHILNWTSRSNLSWN